MTKGLIVAAVAVPLLAVTVLSSATQAQSQGQSSGGGPLNFLGNLFTGSTPKDGQMSAAPSGNPAG